MAADPVLTAFLALDDDAIAAYADDRADALGLALPLETRAGVIDNLALLRRQAAAFITGLDDTLPSAPGTFESRTFEPGTFEP